VKILNIFDTAGIGAIFGKYHDGIVTVQRRALDKFHIDSYYTNVVLYDDMTTMINQAAIDQDDFDHIVIHDIYSTLPAFSRHPSVTMFHHGSTLRGNPELEDRKAHRVFVSTPDLIHYRQTAIHIPSPIDTDLFSNEGIGTGGLMINRMRDKELIEEHVAHFMKGVEYRVRDTQYRSYENMPDLLRQYSFYVDNKYTYEHPPRLLNVMSTTALQALSCGLTVYDSKFEPKVGLPRKNEGRIATDYFIKALNNDI